MYTENIKNIKNTYISLKFSLSFSELGIEDVLSSGKPMILG